MWNNWGNGNKVHVPKAITSISIGAQLGNRKNALMKKKMKTKEISNFKDF
jgi:hypothetical protein